MQNSQADRRNVRLAQHVLAAETRENPEVRTAVVQRLCAVSIWLLGVETLSLCLTLALSCGPKVKPPLYCNPTRDVTQPNPQNTEVKFPPLVQQPSTLKHQTHADFYPSIYARELNSTATFETFTLALKV